MFERFFVPIVAVGIAACGVRSGSDVAPPERKAAESAEVAARPGVASGARDVGASPSRSPSPSPSPSEEPSAIEQRPDGTATPKPSVPENALLLRRQGVSLSPDGKTLVLGPPPSSPEEAAKAGIFRSMPETEQELGSPPR